MKRWIVVVLVCGLSMPVPAGAASGKKHYRQAVALENEKKYDQAAEAYMLALSLEPDNLVYRIAYQRTATQASVMLVRQGREALEQGRYEEAYNLFRRAYQFDKTNELAKDLAERALDLQRKADGLAPAPLTETPYGASIPIIGPNPHSASQQRPTIPSAKDATKDDTTLSPLYQVQDITRANDELENHIRDLAERIGLNIVFDSSFRSRKMPFRMKNVTIPQALDTLLMSNNLFFEPINDNTLLVAIDNTANRARLQQMSVQTFYLKNSDEQTVQTIQTNLSALFGQKVMVVPNAQLRSLTVRTTPETLKLVGNIIRALDKDKPEVLIDVSIYEVSRNDLLEIGNQLLYEGFLPSGSSVPTRPSTLSNLAITAGQVITEQRLALAIPTSILRILQTRGNSKLIDSIQVHALDGQQVRANVGQRIPIQTASFPSSFATTTQTQPNQPPNQNQGGFLGGAFGLGVPQIEYQDVGLNIQITPTIYTDDDIKLEMEIETSGVAAGGTTLTPIFTQRRLKSVATVQTGQAAMMAAVAQNRKETSRGGLPVLGFLPVIGRFFSIPTDRTASTDLLITVTPHVIRSADIREEDQLAMSSGLQLMGLSDTIQSFLEKREQARRGRQSTDVTQKAAAAENKPKPAGSESPAGASPALMGALSPSDTQILTNDQRALVPALTQSALTQSSATPNVASNPLDTKRADAGTLAFMLYSDTHQPKVGQKLSVTVVAQAKEPIGQGSFVIHYSPAIWRLAQVTQSDVPMADGRYPAVSVNQTTDGMVEILVRMPEGMATRPAPVPLARLVFEVVGAGESVIAVATEATMFVSPDGRSFTCTAQPLSLKTVGR
ncbi:MAG: hypothetical protein RMM98_13935 [Acidobacteriota bacterium]|nr:hypothetical protein [Blastocatellia bacterium]MDW8240705.1 hypothetical protein [Acidobacteriota bacterium]